MLIDDSEVRRAKAVLRNAGYYCIPREKVLTVGANHHVSHRNMAAYGSDPGYIQSVYKQMHMACLMEMMKATVGDVRPENDEHGTNYRLTIDILPRGLVTDPVMDMIREPQR